MGEDLTCKCGKSYDTKQQLTIHQLSRNCNKAPVGRSSTGVSRSASRTRPKTTGAKLPPKDEHGRFLVPNKSEYPNRHGELVSRFSELEWHLTLSVYYKVPVDYYGSPEELQSVLKYIEGRFRDVIKDIRLEELPEVRVSKLRVGYNTVHCKLNKMQKMFGSRTKGNKKGKRQ